MSPFELSVLFFLQITFILVVCCGVGQIAKYLGQPQVVAEMIAGVLMGPSLFGLFWPEAQGYLFPAESKPILFVFSQVGLVLYMFLIGLEFDTSLIRQRIASAASTSIAGIATPMVLGGLLGLGLTKISGLFGADVSQWEASLFLGAAVSITAFPMLARIIHERGLAGTSLGTLALAAGSIDDAAAWCILAIVLASFSGDPQIAIFAIGGGVPYAVAILTIGKWLLKRLGTIVEHQNNISGAMLTFVLILVMLGAWFTDKIGIYAVFGAFILGAAMPRGVFAHKIQERVEPVVTNFLLPMFFVYSGLQTRIGLVDTPTLWGIAVLVLLVACLGKGVACWAAARWSGENQRDALAIGTLMNARGLMELIILNIGLERGIISPVLFTIMVTMAIGTTLMASPIFEWVYREPKLVLIRQRPLLNEQSRVTP
jgi:Kef-type K+ transport system membrane component KefB